MEEVRIVIKKINKLTALLLAWTFVLGTMGITSVFAAETTLDFAGVGHTKYNDANYVGTNLDMSGMGQTSGHVLFFQYDISGYSADTILNSAIWKAFCSNGTNWNNPMFRIMTFDCEKSLGTFNVNHNELLESGYVEDSNVLWSGLASSISTISFTSEIPEGEDSPVNRYNIDFTDAVRNAIRAGKKYFNFVIKPYSGYNELSFFTNKNPLPQLIIDTVIPPKIEIAEHHPVEEGTAFDISAAVTKGDAEIESVVLSVEDANGKEYTDFSEAVIIDNTYTWSFPATMPSSSYKITVEVTDKNALTATKNISMRVLGTETFNVVTASSPVKTAVTYNEKWLNSNDVLMANNNSIIAYFEYDLSENSMYNLKSAELSCPDDNFSGTAELYAVTTGWDEESIKSGNIPKLSAQPVATSNGHEVFDLSSYIIEQLRKGVSNIGFALKTTSGEVKINRKDMVLSLEQSDNKRPEIIADISKCFVPEDMINLFIKDDDFITAVTATIDSDSCIVSKGADNQWNVEIPSHAAKGVHKLIVSAKDYSGAETVKEYAINIDGIFGEHTLVISDGAATATVSNVEDGTILIIAAYKNNELLQLIVESDVAGGALSATLDISGEDNNEISYKSYICTYSNGFKLIDVQ